MRSRVNLQIRKSTGGRDMLDDYLLLPSARWTGSAPRRRSGADVDDRNCAGPCRRWPSPAAAAIELAHLLSVCTPSQRRADCRRRRRIISRPRRTTERGAHAASERPRRRVTRAPAPGPTDRPTDRCCRNTKQIAAASSHAAAAAAAVSTAGRLFQLFRPLRYARRKMRDIVNR